MTNPTHCTVTPVAPGQPDGLRSVKDARVASRA
jgi:hypothetical protein